MNAAKIIIHWAKDHNPGYDIITYSVDNDTTITYCKPILKEAGETYEVYVGKNYNVNSTKRSYSRSYKDFNKVPKHWQPIIKQLKEYLNNITFVLTEFKI